MEVNYYIKFKTLFSFRDIISPSDGWVSTTRQIVEPLSGLIGRLFNVAMLQSIKLFGDKRENAIHLYDRDWSLQRRDQKIIEEAPDPNVPTEFWTHTVEAALTATKVIYLILSHIIICYGLRYRFNVLMFLAHYTVELFLYSPHQ